MRLCFCISVDSRAILPNDAPWFKGEENLAHAFVNYSHRYFGIHMC